MNIKEFADKYNSYESLEIPNLPKGAVVYMLTEHSTYTLTIIDPLTSRVIAEGGYFHERKKEPCKTYVIGSTNGGSMIFKNKLIVGLICEFDKNILTSNIKKIFVNISN